MSPLTGPNFRSPRWMVSHAFVLLLLVAFVAAGFWQLDRLDERRDQNAAIRARIDGVPVAIDALTDIDAGALEYRPVVASGRFSDRELLVSNRANDGVPGFWAWTVFVLDDGTETIVNRGFVRRTMVIGDGADASTWAPPRGRMTIAGVLRVGDLEGRVSASETEISRPDASVAVAVLGVTPILDPEIYVELDAAEPPLPAGGPELIPPPELSEGPHLSYAFQWFTFTLIGLIGYPLALRRIRRGDASRGDVPAGVPV